MNIASKNENWIARKIDKDYGLDIELELVDKSYVTGQYVKVQVKSVAKYEVKESRINVSIKTNFLKYCNECRVPILLIIVDNEQNKGYFIWVQEYLRRNSIVLKKTASKTLKIPIENDFSIGLNNIIKDIACGINHTQLQLDLKACLSSAFLLGDSEIYEKLTELSIDITKTNSLEINKIIEDLISLGNKNLGNFEIQKKSKILYNFCRRFGDNFTLNHILNMVIRGKSYSRIGITALGILYDEFPKHLISLNLPKKFKNYEDLRMNYYCLLREKYIGKKSSEIINNKETDFKINKIFILEEYKSELYMKWLYKGDCIILDYLVLEK